MHQELSYKEIIVSCPMAVKMLAVTLTHSMHFDCLGARDKNFFVGKLLMYIGFADGMLNMLFSCQVFISIIYF